MDPILKPMVSELMKKRPENVSDFFIHFCQTRAKEIESSLNNASVNRQRSIHFEEMKKNMVNMANEESSQLEKQEPPVNVGQDASQNQSAVSLPLSGNQEQREKNHPESTANELRETKDGKPINKPQDDQNKNQKGTEPSGESTNVAQTQQAIHKAQEDKDKDINESKIPQPTPGLSEDQK